MGNPFSKSKGKKNKKSLSSSLSNLANAEDSSIASSTQGRQRQGSVSQRQKKKKNEGIRESKLAERQSQLEGFRHFVKLNVCSVMNTLPLSSSASYTTGAGYNNTLTQGSMASGGSVPFASPSFSTHSDVLQQWSASMMMETHMANPRSTLTARLSHLEFDAICRHFDSAVTCGLPGTWTLPTLQNMLCLSDSIALRLYSWIRLSTPFFPLAAATQGLNDLIANAPCLAFEEFFQWLIDCLYPSSPLSSLLSETVRNVHTVTSQMTSSSFTAGSSIGRRLPWSASSSVSYGTDPRKYAAGPSSASPSSGPMNSRSGSPVAEAKIPYEFWFYLFASHASELTRSNALPGSRPRSQTHVLPDHERSQRASNEHHDSHFHEIRSHYYLTKVNFKALVHWLLDVQFKQMHDLPSAEPPLAEDTAEELRVCHRLVEGIVENSIENLYLSPVVTKLPIASDEALGGADSMHRSGSALSLFSDFGSDTSCPAGSESVPTVSVLGFYTWRDWMQRNLPRFFDVFPLFLRAKFLSMPPPSPPTALETALPPPSPSPSPLIDFKTHTKHASIVSLNAILPESVSRRESHLLSAGSSFDRLRRVSESNMGRGDVAEAALLATTAATSTSAPDPSYSSLILDTTLLWLLYHCLPEYSLPWRPQSSLSSENRSNDSAYSMLVPWELLYSTMRDGYSMTRFRHGCFDYPGSTLLLIQGECRAGPDSSQSVVLGAVVSTPWKMSGASWGNDECVIVLLYPVVEVLQVKHRAEAFRERRQTTLPSNLTSYRGPYSNSLSKATTPTSQTTYGRSGYSSSMSPSFYMPPGKAVTGTAIKPSSLSPAMHPVYCHVDNGIGFGGVFTALGSGLAAKPDTQAFRLYIDAYFNTCTLNLHGQDDTYCASYLPFSTLGESDQGAAKGFPIVLPAHLKLDIAHLEVFGLGGPDALAKWSQSKAFDKRLIEQRQSINVKLKRRELESEKMLLNLVGIMSEYS